MSGLGPIDYTEPGLGNNNITQLVLDSSTGGGTMTGTVTATRGSKSVVVHFDFYRTIGTTNECFSRADVTLAG